MEDLRLPLLIGQPSFAFLETGNLLTLHPVLIIHLFLFFLGIPSKKTNFKKAKVLQMEHQQKVIHNFLANTKKLSFDYGYTSYFDHHGQSIKCHLGNPIDIAIANHNSKRLNKHEKKWSRCHIKANER